MLSCMRGTSDVVGRISRPFAMKTVPEAIGTLKSMLLKGEDHADHYGQSDAPYIKPGVI